MTATRRQPEDVLKKLEEHLDRLVVEGPIESIEDGPAHYEKRLLSMVKIIKGYRETMDDDALCLHALERFAAFGAGHWDNEQLEFVRAAVEQFANHLKGQRQ